MKKWIVPAAVTAAAAALTYYFLMPAINLHSAGFWIWIALLLGIFTLLLTVTSGYGNRPAQPSAAFFGFEAQVTPQGIRFVKAEKKGKKDKHGADAQWEFSAAEKTAKICWKVLAVLILIFIVMNLYSAPIFHAKAYAEQGAQRISEGNFEEDVAVVKNGVITDIAIMDTATATTLGSRQIGSLGTLATQYELGTFMTTTINGEITKVAPLGYGSFFKWLNSRGSGMPGYVTVDPVVGTSAYVKLDNPMFYSDTGYFNDNAYRRMRFAFPTAIFYNMHFEIDNDGNPYWVATVDSFKVGLFGCEVPGGVITCDAVTGECALYTADEAPDWVSIVYTGDDLMRLVNYAGLYSHGFFNSILAKKDVYSCTDDYGYKIVDENLNAFTGITSAAGDESNIGFVLCDEHTGQIIRYSVYGAEEYSAMTSAEGLVLNYGYAASFPSICNVEGSPVYVMALTDSGSLIKKYALVDLQDYTKVEVGDTVAQAWKNYVTKYCGGSASEVSGADAYEAYTVEVASLLAEPVLATVGGESYWYLYAADGSIYRLPFDGNEDVKMLDWTQSLTLTVTGEVHDGVYEAEQ